MSRRRHVWHPGLHQWVDVTNAPRPKRVGAYIMRDSMDAILHPATGQVTDSKSHFRAMTRASGMVEMGNDAPLERAPPPPPDERDIERDIAGAIQMLNQGYQPPPVDPVDADTRILN